TNTRSSLDCLTCRFPLGPIGPEECLEVIVEDCHVVGNDCRREVLFGATEVLERRAVSGDMTSPLLIDLVLLLAVRPSTRLKSAVSVKQCKSRNPQGRQDC